jgi:hypothetical protein
VSATCLAVLGLSLLVRSGVERLVLIDALMLGVLVAFFFLR